MASKPKRPPRKPAEVLEERPHPGQRVTTVRTIEQLNDAARDPNIIQDEYDADPADVELMDRLEPLREEEDAIVQIYRQGTHHNDLTLLAEVSALEFRPIMLAHPPYKGGRFRIHARTRAGMRINKMMQVAAAPAVQQAEEELARRPQQTSAELAAVLTAGFDRILQAVTQRTDPLGSIENMERLLRAMRPAGGGAEQLLATLDIVEKVRKMTRSEVAPIASGDDGFSTGALMKQALAMLMGAAQQQAAAQLPTQANQAQPGAPGQDRSNSANDDQKTPGLDGQTQADQDNMMMMQIAVRRAIAAAKRLEDPRAFAEDSFDLVPEDAMRTLVTREQWFDLLAAVNDGVRPFFAWFDQVRARYREIAREVGLLTSAPRVVSIAENNKNGGGESAAQPASPRTQ